MATAEPLTADSCQPLSKCAIFALAEQESVPCHRRSLDHQYSPDGVRMQTVQRPSRPRKRHCEAGCRSPTFDTHSSGMYALRVERPIRGAASCRPNGVDSGLRLGRTGAPKGIPTVRSPASQRPLFAKRVGYPRDSGPLARRVVPPLWNFVAGPDYIGEHGASETLAEFAVHSALLQGTEATQFFDGDFERRHRHGTRPQVPRRTPDRDTAKLSSARAIAA